MIVRKVSVRVQIYHENHMREREILKRERERERERERWIRLSEDRAVLGSVFFKQHAILRLIKRERERERERERDGKRDDD